MSDIKFKGKRLDNGELVHGYFVMDDCDCAYIITVENDGYSAIPVIKTCYEVDAETVVCAGEQESKQLVRLLETARKLEIKKNEDNGLPGRISKEKEAWLDGLEFATNIAIDFFKVRKEWMEK
ncbi:hypothetical protein E1R44_14140 [Listeria monocytogenes]|uniref:hypothetical protein n=1 Tax=Listeria monocytogenes TaxID=1639 RepID=UPI0007669161|nr:hypothetical protein [Listeria monocytogenes]EAE3993356.1 hypothetical protein [Listeria monocytogenes]MIL11602.1 hypothetical protein [Listeria monocytogenes]CWV36361.1 Uncharacterised protein [Listeria monocytogenes]CWW74199.1 Uncharacterised protein [Listeria monocytogenes]HAJ9419567.1 hypothetical protein [Listeria monocytogenes]